MTEAQVVAVIDRIARILSSTFVFGYYDRDDIEQEARLFGIKAMEKYDPSRPLENFIYSAVRSRLLNLRRDRLRRNDPPCKVCHLHFSANGPGHPNGQICKKYEGWRKRNTTKANLMRPLGIDYVSDEKEARSRCNSEVVGDAETNEILHLINLHLPMDLRADFLRMRDGVNIPKVRRQQVETAVREIIKCPNEDD
jgi:DNA-directed RNA polymerase specialized sigma24 family protein